jgi:hypothetical protein
MKSSVKVMLDDGEVTVDGNERRRACESVGACVIAYGKFQPSGCSGDMSVTLPRDFSRDTSAERRRIELEAGLLLGSVVVGRLATRVNHVDIKKCTRDVARRMEKVLERFERWSRSCCPRCPTVGTFRRLSHAHQYFRTPFFLFPYHHHLTPSSTSHRQVSL